jgi:hypothetical protein
MRGKTSGKGMSYSLNIDTGLKLWQLCSPDSIDATIRSSAALPQSPRRRPEPVSPEDTTPLCTVPPLLPARLDLAEEVDEFQGK